ncbi:MAG TPA: trypsin-like serine protease [Pyrinomonadaceae bacterium]|jgi:V8-like Glu-specific endopeptidase
MIPRTIRFASKFFLPASVILLTALAAQAQKGNVSSLNSAQNALVPAARPWTREEMLAAKPYPLAEPAYDKGDIYTVAPVKSGTPFSSPGGMGGASEKTPTAAEAVAEVAFGPDPEPNAPPAYAYPFPFSRWENLPAARYADFPYRTIGKVFFTKFGGGSFVCSGSSIGNYAVITAGHCVSDGLGHFHTNWVFVPAYNSGSAPYGQWAASFLTTRAAWHTGGGNDYEEDIGGAILNKLAGLKISQKVGWLGFQSSQSIVQHWHSIGYPAAAPFTGAKQIICAAGYAKTDVVNGVLMTFGIGCDATGGTSGGPLIKNFANNAAANNYVNGVNSYKYTTTQPKALYSPYFGANALAIFNCLRYSGPGVLKCVAPAVL